MTRPALWPASISGRLALLYTLGALLSVGLFALLANWKLEANFAAEHRAFLRAKAAEFQDDLRDGAPATLVQEILTETSGVRLRSYQARVLRAGRVLGGTPGMATALPATLFPAASSASSASFRAHHADGAAWLLTSLTLPAASGPEDLVLQIALDVTQDQALITDFHRALAVFFLLLVPLLLGAGRLVAAQALAPVARIASVARSVTPAQLSRRIPEDPPWPSELAGLVQIFNRMLDNLETGFARLSRFSGDIAHELRTPLSNLTGSLEVCLGRPRTEADYRAAIASALEDGQRLTGLIENLLFLARVENPSHALRHERCDAAELCAWVVARHEPQLRLKQVQTRIEGAATLYADALLLRQAVANVLANAVRHTPPGSTIVIALSGTPATGVAIAIADQGPGIAAEHVPGVFDRFYQTDPARGHADAQGAGLGLAIVQSIMDLHGGRVTIDGAPDQGERAGTQAGARVTLRFPPLEA